MNNINIYHKILIGEWETGGSRIIVKLGIMTEDAVICGKVHTEIELLDNPSGIFDYKLFIDNGNAYFSFNGLKYLIEKFDINVDGGIMMVEEETKNCLFLIKPID